MCEGRHNIEHRKKGERGVGSGINTQGGHVCGCVFAHSLTSDAALQYETLVPVISF